MVRVNEIGAYILKQELKIQYFMQKSSNFSKINFLRNGSDIKNYCFFQNYYIKLI